MKLRIHGESIRFRLNRKEVSDFLESGRISSSVHFPGGAQLTYALESAPALANAEAKLNGSTIVVSLPQGEARRWAAGDDVAISASTAGLDVLIEKDFQCMHKGEDAKDPDAYPNPLAV